MGEYDPDTGDISLSLPSSGSLPHLSTLLDSSSRNSSPSPSPSSRTPSARLPLAAPSPTRLLGKGLWAKTQSFNDAGSSRTSPSLNGSRSTTPGIPSVSLNDDEDDGPPTPLGGPSFWGLPDRPSSATPQRSAPQVDPSYLNSTPTAPYGFNRRTSSSGNVSRSRSLNIRLGDVVADPDLMHASPSRAGGSGSGVRTPSMRIGWARKPGDPRPPPLVTTEVRDRMSRWVKEIVVCNFDLERGPVVERRALGRRWGPGEKENVAFSSFPDTSLFSEGSILFSFKIRHIPPDPTTLTLPEPPSPLPDRLSPGGHIPTVEQGLLNLSEKDSLAPPSPSPSAMSQFGSSESKAEEYRRWDERGREWLYGYVWFEQKKDRGIARGYMQKSLVILTHLPFPSLFFAVLDRCAPIFFKHGYSALEAACHSIASWPDPRSDAVLELPFMSEVINAKLPDSAETPQIGRAFGTPWTGSNPVERPLLVSLPHSAPLRAFASFLPALWSLWECLVLAEPVLVIAPDPRTCSEIVWWLRDLLRPIPPAGDFRPYLHIHDHDFSLLVNSNKPQAGVVVGVTNPFFRNAASHWPNVISIPGDRPRRVTANGSSSPRPPEVPEGFLSRRHRSVQKDRTLLKRLEAVVAEGDLDDPAANEALRTHFQQLTEKMLVPLNRYFQTLIPSPSTPSTTAQTIKPFSLPTFLTHLRNHGPNPLLFRTKGLSTKSRVESDFYASFCMSPTFAGWLHARIHSLGTAVAATAQNPSTPSLSGYASPISPRTIVSAQSKSRFGPGGAGGATPPIGLGINEAKNIYPSSEEGRVELDSHSDATRQSSESSGGNWRASEETPRSVSPAAMDYLVGGRRGSEGLVRGLGHLSVTQKERM